MKVANAIVEFLQREKIKVVFGYPGATISPLYEALSSSKILNVVSRHEQNAGHSANGYARASKKVGVCIATSGPGATNLITAIASAYMDSIPMVIITGQVSSKLIGRDVFQEADIIGACEPFVKHSYLIKDSSEIISVLKESFYIAKSGRPGPVLIDIPVDILDSEVKNINWDTNVDIIGYKPNVKGHPLQIKKAVQALKDAKKPVICAGGGVVLSNAQEELLNLANKCNIPVVNTLMGVGILPSESTLKLGLLGKYGVSKANYAITNADVLIICGARVGDRTFSENKEYSDIKTVIHIDIDPAEIGKNLKADIPIVGDLKIVLEDLLNKCESASHSDWIKECNDITTNEITSSDYKYVNPINFLKKISNEFDNAIVTCDVGQHQIWCANTFNIKNGRFFTSGGMGTMGYSLPCAVGCAFADNKTDVICVCGDGGFQMCMNELATAKKYDLNIKIIVLNNNSLGMVKEYQEHNNLATFGVDMDYSPDFCNIASAYDIPSIRIEDNNFDDVINNLKSTKGPFVLEVCVDSSFPSRGEI